MVFVSGILHSSNHCQYCFFLGGGGVSRRVVIINCHGMSTTNSVGFTGKTLEYLGKINDLTDLTQTSFYLSVWENIDDLAKGVT